MDVWDCSEIAWWEGPWVGGAPRWEGPLGNGTETVSLTTYW